MSSSSDPNPSLLQLKYLHKPCSPPSIPLRLTLATFILLFTPCNCSSTLSPVPASWSVPVCPCLRLLGLPVVSRATLVAYEPRKVPGLTGMSGLYHPSHFRRAHSIIITSLISYSGRKSGFEWLSLPFPVLACAHLPNVAAQA